MTGMHLKIPKLSFSVKEMLVEAKKDMQHIQMTEV